MMQYIPRHFISKVAVANAKGSEHMLNRVMTKDNIALAALLETKPTVWEQSQLPADTESQHQQILVCTAHIHWDPEFCDVKLIQVRSKSFSNSIKCFLIQ